MVVEIVVGGAVVSIAVLGYGMVRLTSFCLEMAGAFDTSADEDGDQILNADDDEDMDDEG